MLWRRASREPVRLLLLLLLQVLPPDPFILLPVHCPPPGLAHFCEHMLFLGTEKYPENSAPWQQVRQLQRSRILTA